MKSYFFSLLIINQTNELSVFIPIDPHTNKLDCI